MEDRPGFGMCHKAYTMLSVIDDTQHLSIVISMNLPLQMSVVILKSNRAFAPQIKFKSGIHPSIGPRIGIQCLKFDCGWAFSQVSAGMVTHTISLLERRLYFSEK